MNHSTFDWDDANLLHLAAHDVTPDEAEQAVTDEPYDLMMEIRDHEERLTQVGQTRAGRILVVVTILRGTKIRVVTGYPADRRQQTIYMKARGGIVQ